MIYFKQINRVMTFFLLFIFVFSSRNIFAQEEITESFYVDIRANLNNTFDVTEVIRMDFFEERHGIYRDIPYKKGRASIENIEVEGEEYKIDKKALDGNHIVRIKIGSDDETVSGKHEYKIRYSIVIPDDGDLDQDLLYLDLLPSFWSFPIDKAEVKLTLPKEIDWKNVRYFSGKYGETSLSDKFHIQAEEKVLTVNVEKLEKEEGFTLRTVLPEGYWEGETPKKRNMEAAVVIMICVLVAVPLIMGGLWYFFGRGEKVVPTVEFYAPESITPVDAGYILRGSPSKRDFFSLIPYFAQKGYIQIKKFSDRTVLYRLAPSSELYEKEKPYVVCFYEMLFPQDKYELDTKEMIEYRRGKRNLDPYQFERIRSYESAEKFIEKEYDGNSHSLYTTKSKRARILGFILLMLIPFSALFCTKMYIGEPLPGAFHWISVLFFFATVGMMRLKKERYAMGVFFKTFLFLMSFGMLAFGAYSIYRLMRDYFVVSYTLFFVLSYLVGLFFQLNLYTRNKESAELVGKLTGLKEFIRIAEVDRLNMLSDEDPAYFYEILPYAHAFDLATTWISKFESIPVEAPSWFGGDRGRDHYSSHDIISAVSDSVFLFSDSVLTKETNDGSDSGSSGGGYGGGGGGSW